MRAHENHDWTDERCDRLRLMCASPERPSAGQMGIDLGVSRNAIIGKVARLGLVLPNHGVRSPTGRSASPGRPKRKHGFHPNTRTVCQQPVEPIIVTNEATDQAIPIEQRRTLVELEPGMCRWPVGHPGTPDFFFCGGTALEERPYCIHHDRRAYQPSKPQRRSTYNPARRAA